MGSGGVGKSALTVRFINASYLEWYDPTIEDSYRKQFTVDGQACLLEILDTAGIEQYLTLNDLFIRESQGFVLVFSLTQRDTFREILKLRDTIYSIKSTFDIPIVIVGNKSDLGDEREVETSEGEKLAERWGVRYFETSARTDTNVWLVFEEIVRKIRSSDHYKRPKRRMKGPKCVIM
ncbi:hypothetical protein M231_01294 [Tremella mesenterica]|uniref:Uncharacterized protein n=1 Tax=Tremella mesenterica TaxID=5217 RepID=A0A4Q1BTI6_TREME|nr:hypothetical protein M231_01294 [Tremella mesenterica]